MPSSLFLTSNPPEDPLYARIRDRRDVHAEEWYQILEEMWSDFERYAPRRFRRNMQVSFHQRWWEMYLTLGLARLDLTVITSRRDHGPDILLEFGEQKVWVEAVAPTAGESTDAVPQPILNSCQDLPMRESILRLTSAVGEKRDKFETYIQQGIVSENDPCIIAVSSCCLNQFSTILDFPQPVMLRVLAGAGNLVISANRANQSYSEFADTTHRDSESLVDLNLFNKDGYEIVSGVLYSANDPLNAPSRPEEALELFINPNSQVEVPSGLSDTMPSFFDVSTEQEICWQRNQPSRE